ncbi:MAG: hypothetical protein KTR20_01895 [Cellvibrionaceae bacterium]|nr:hypothetical protein [Cellvibrionaceae bacterium]
MSIFLYYEGIKGESSDNNYKDCIDEVSAKYVQYNEDNNAVLPSTIGFDTASNTRK